MKKWYGILGLGGLLVITAWLLLSATWAGAETMKWRTVSHTTKVEAIQVGDVPGHIIGVGEARGLAFLENGEIASTWEKFTVDYVNGSGPHAAYGLTTLEDGSSIVIKFQGTTTADQAKKTSWFTGTFSFTQGSGRFAGIQGGGSYTGKRFEPLTGGADLYIDFAGDYTVPSR